MGRAESLNEKRGEEDEKHIETWSVTKKVTIRGS